LSIADHRWRQRLRCAGRAPNLPVRPYDEKSIAASPDHKARFRPSRIRRKQVQDRQRESRGFAGAGLSDPDHVAARYGDRDGLHFDRGRVAYFSSAIARAIASLRPKPSKDFNEELSVCASTTVARCAAAGVCG